MSRHQNDDAPLQTDAPSQEREVLGSIMAAPEMLRYAHSISAEDFGVSIHRTMWRAIARLADKGDDITPRAVTALCGEDMRDHPKDLAFEMSDNASATAGVVTAAVERMIDAARRRRLVEVFADARRQTTQSDEPLDTIVSRAATQIDRAALGNRSTFLSGRQAADKLKERLLKPNQRIPTGLKKFDFILGGGLPRGRLISLIAKPKTGKTTMVTTISYNLAEMKIPHLVLGLERSETDMEMMQAARWLGTTGQQLERKFKSMEVGYDQFAADPSREYCHYHHAAGNTLDEIRYAILRAVRNYGIEVFLLDYYQIVERPPRESVVDHLARVAQTMANLTNTLNVAGVVTAQADADGLPKDCKVLWHAASANFVIRRAIDQAETWLENIGSNFIGNEDVGSARDPAMVLDTGAGPHFKNP